MEILQKRFTAVKKQLRENRYEKEKCGSENKELLDTKQKIEREKTENTGENWKKLLRKFPVSVQLLQCLSEYKWNIFHVFMCASNWDHV